MSRTSLPDALAECLTRIEGGESVGAVLADHPEHVAELRALVAAAAAVRAHRPLPPPAFRAALQHHLAEGGPAPSAAWRRPWRWALRLGAALAAVTVAFSGLAVASADSRPGDLLYPVRRGVGAVRNAAERVSPPIGRAIDYLTIREVPDDPSAAAATPTLALAPGSRLLERRGAGTGVQDDDGDEAAPPQAAATDGSRTLPRPFAVAVDRGGPPPDGDAALPATPAPRATADGPATASPAPRRTATAEPSASPPPAPAPTVTPPLDVSAAGGIAGRVTGQDDVGVVGALVSVYPIGRDGNLRFSQWRGVRTADDGTYFIANLPAGRYKLAVGELAPWVWRVWYGGTIHVKKAEPIAVEAGRLSDGIDVALRRSPWGFDWGGGARRPPPDVRRPRP